MKNVGKKYFIMIFTIFLCISSLLLLFYNKTGNNVTFKNMLVFYAILLVCLNFVLFFIFKNALNEKIEKEYPEDVQNNMHASSTNIRKTNKNVTKLPTMNKNLKTNNITFKDNHLKSKTNPMISNANLITESNRNINSLYSKIKELSKFNNNIKSYSKENASNFKNLTEADESIQKSFESIDSKTKEISSIVLELGNSINKLNDSVEKLNALVFNISMEDNHSDKGKGKEDFSNMIGDLRKLSKDVLSTSKDISNLIYKVKYEVYNLSTLNESAFHHLKDKTVLNNTFSPCFDHVLTEVSHIMSNLVEMYKVVDTNLEIRNSLLEKANLLPT